MIDILTVLDTRDNYLLYYNTIDKYITDTNIRRVLKDIGSYYTDTKEDNIDWSVFSTYFFVKNPLIKGTQKVIFETLFDKLLSSTPTTLKTKLVDILVTRYHADRIAHKTMDVLEGKVDDLDEIAAEITEWSSKTSRAALRGSELLCMDLDDILEGVAPGSGLSWRMRALNTSLGPLRKGDFVFFGARPEVGKTTLLCSEATYMATQLTSEQKVLYFTNEEGEPVRLRMYQALLGADLPTLQSNRSYYTSQYIKMLHGDRDKIMIINKPFLHVRDIEYWMQKENAGLICIDQLRKIQGFESIKGGGIQRMEKIAQTAREWAKEYAPILTVGQLDFTAENREYPDMSSLYESKTAVQGECDVIINIGKVDGSMPPNARWLNICKNKLKTPGDVTLRHAKHEVRIHSEIARYV